MSLIATIINPMGEPVPAEWDRFVIEHRLLPLWRADLVTAADWCDPAPATLVLVGEPTGAPCALFHARHPGLRRPGRYCQPEAMPPVSLASCQLAASTNSAGMAFAAGTDPRDQAAAVRVFEQSVRRRGGPGTLGLAYHNLRAEDLPAVRTRWRRQLAVYPRMVLHNEWPDLAGYLAGLPTKWRSQLRGIHRSVAADPDVRVAQDDPIRPADAAWLAATVHRRHAGRGRPAPPLPEPYLARLLSAPGIHTLTYRDANGRLLGYAVVHDDGRELLLIMWGSRGHTDGYRRDLYFDLYLRLIDQMVRTGRDRLVLGKGMTKIKARFGARPVPLWGVVGMR